MTDTNEKTPTSGTLEDRGYQTPGQRFDSIDGAVKELCRQSIGMTETLNKIDNKLDKHLASYNATTATTEHRLSFLESVVRKVGWAIVLAVLASILGLVLRPSSVETGKSSSIPALAPGRDKHPADRANPDADDVAPLAHGGGQFGPPSP